MAKNDSLLFLMMDNETKIQLSPFEMDLLNNSEWILTKNVIIKKAQQLLEKVQQNIIDYSRQYPVIFAPPVVTVSPKISKGENYQGLPWLILDYPRYFDKENIFAIRTMFWWGNFFSSTLHLSGAFKQKHTNAIINSYEQFLKNEFYTCIHPEQWHHHFETDNYEPVKSLTPSEFSIHIREKSFIKLAAKVPFLEWDHAVKLLSENFARIVQCIL